MTYQIGDVVNGHRLGSDNQWHPVEPSTAGHEAPPPPAGPPAGATAAPVPPAPALQKPWYKRWWVIALAVVLVIVVWPKGGGNAANTSSPATAPSAAPAPAAPAAPSAAPAPAAPAAPGLNTPVRDGDFEFTVTKIQCGVPSVGGQFGKAAQGQFCLVSTNVKNIGKDAQIFDSSSQKALDAQGNKLSADGGAAIYLPDSRSFLNSINPGNQVSGVVVFDIPKSATITELELHDSLFSNGAKVKAA